MVGESIKPLSGLDSAATDTNRDEVSVRNDGRLRGILDA